MTIDQLVKEAHGTAIDKGWWIYPRTNLEIYALIHSEISEATEAFRDDAVIRIADFCGKKSWDLTQMLEMKLAKNRSRPFRHGGKLA